MHEVIGSPSPATQESGEGAGGEGRAPDDGARFRALQSWAGAKSDGLALTRHRSAFSPILEA